MNAEPLATRSTAGAVTQTVTGWIDASPVEAGERDGAVVVLRAWESHEHGEGRQRVE